MKISIHKLQENVKQAERNLEKAEQRLNEARICLQEALKQPETPEFNVFKKWKVWSNKRNYDDVANVDGYYQPPQSWRDLKDFIKNKKGWKFHQGGTWDWIEELSEYIGENEFKNAPLSDEKMTEAIKSIMEYDVDYHFETETWDM